MLVVARAGLLLELGESIELKQIKSNEKVKQKVYAGCLYLVQKKTDTADRVEANVCFAIKTLNPKLELAEI